MSKEYLENEYKIAVLDFKLARSEDEQWQARKTMAKIECLAMEIYGFKYADELHNKYLS